MARSNKDFAEKRAQLVQAAMHVFARQGYESTTNKLVAEEMERMTGVSLTPQLIYHYFASKEELFQAVVQQFSPPQTIGSIVRDSMDEPPAIFFRRVATRYLELFDDPIRLNVLRISFTEGIRQPLIAESIADRLYPEFLEPCMQYLLERMERGELRCSHPAVVLSMFYGTLIQQLIPLTQILVRRSPLEMPDRETFVEELVTNFLTGLEIPSGQPKSL
jgi:AcrR family transcriptional regulator